MDLQESLIDQLETAIAGKSVSRRADVLRRVTDLFVLGSGAFSEAQVELFGDVMSRLVKDIEIGVRGIFGSRLSKLSDAPRGVIRGLAFDDAIEVAGPVLRDSPRLTDATLVECSRTMSQCHLHAIAGRAVVTEPVTDVLIDRGDIAVIASLVDNQGASFSGDGLARLVTKTLTDSDIATVLWSRSDIPRQTLLTLFVQVSTAVRMRLEAADPKKAEQIRSAVRNATDAIQATARKGSQEHNQALAHVGFLNAKGKLNETALLGFAKDGTFDRIAVALSIMCNLPIGLVERALIDKQSEQLLLFAKAVGLSWETVKVLLAVQSGADGIGSDQMAHLFKSFAKLKAKTAQTALHFYRLRERASDQ